MTAQADIVNDEPKKGSKVPVLLGLVLALSGGAGGYFAVQTGMIGAEESTKEQTQSLAGTTDHAIVSFVAIDPLVISLPRSGGRDHLRFSAQLEVEPAYVAEVESVKPRIVDILNGYLRAVDLAELEDPAALSRLRAQMLRRVQVVTGDGRVKDLLIMEFVLS